MTKAWLAGVMAVVLTAALLAPTVSEARRLGGAKSTGMQRSVPAQQSSQTPPSQPAAPQPTAPTPSPVAAPAAAGATAAATAPARRSWLGPIAGLAAGLGLAALLSHLGLGDEFASMLMLALLAVAAFFLIRFVLRRLAGAGSAGRLAPAGADLGTTRAPRDLAQRRAEPTSTPMPQPPVSAPAGAEVSVTGKPLAAMGVVPGSAAAVDTSPALKLPEGFDLPAFERVAKMIFIRLQAANDAADLDDLRQFTTPEMFADARLEIQERAGQPQHTDVERVEAQVLDFAREEGRQIVSVRFHGIVRESKDGPAEPFDEIWHLVKPDDDSRPWAIAGIQQPQ